MNKFKVPIRNALYMYSYIWDKVDSDEYINISAKDDFKSADIYIELFLLNVRRIIKRGLYKEYKQKSECLNIIKGKIDFNRTINTQSLMNGKLYCSYDELNEDNKFNQILKYIAIRLLKSKNISLLHKQKLNRVIHYFSQIEYKEINKSDFNNLIYNRSNNYYFIMMKICELILNSQMLSEETGEFEFFDLFNSDENMNIVFELFVNKFYQYELPKNYRVKYQSILNLNFTGGNQNLLPLMKLDTLISNENETIIMDTKYYKNYLIENYDTKKLRSGHIYQMMSYMNNIKSFTENLRGILLYPLPFGEKSINESYEVKVIDEDKIRNAIIQFSTINLNDDWKKIKIDLLNLIFDEQNKEGKLYE